MTHLFRLAAVVLLALTAFGARAQALAGLARPANNTSVVDGIIVKVDNQIVLRSDLEGIYQQQQQQAEGKPLPPDLRCRILQSLTLNKLMLAKAETDSVTVTDERVNGELNRRMNYFVQQIGSEKKLEEFYNKPLRQLKEELRVQVREQLVQQEMQEKISGKVTVTPREVRQFFNKIPKDSLPYYSTEVEVGQIVKLAKPDAKAEQAVLAKMNDLRAQILAGADFAKLARENSQDPVSAKDGGNLGFFKRKELVPEYEAAALRLQPGGLSPIVKSQFGYHLIQLIEKKGDSYNTRHILMKPSAGGTDAAAEELTKLRTRIQQDSITFAKAAKDFSEDKETNTNGGLLQNRRDGGSALPLDQLDPAIFFTIDTMKVGSISKPLPYRTDDGQDAVRIIWLKSNRPPHQANLKDDYQKIATAALNQKKNKALDEWFLRNRGSVFIEVDPEYAACRVLDVEQ